MSENAIDAIAELGRDHQCFEVCVLEDVGEFILDIAVVDVHPHGTKLEHRPERLDPLGTVQRIDAHVIAGADALRGQMVGQLIRTCIHLAVGEPGVVAHDVVTVGPGIDRLLEEVRQIERRCRHRAS